MGTALLLAALTSQTSAVSFSYDSTDVPKNVDDANPALSILVSADSGTITDLNVFVDIRFDIYG